MATVYGSVIRDAGKFKMWYKSGMGVGYAESEDGMQWYKPRLDCVPIDGERSNILFRKKSKKEGPEALPYYYELFGVHRDDADPDPTRRYKMGFLCIDWQYRGADGDPWHKGQRHALDVGCVASTLSPLWSNEESQAGGHYCLANQRLVRPVVFRSGGRACGITGFPPLELQQTGHRPRGPYG